MDNWDSLYPFTTEEINLFSRLHQKATKFPAPSNIKVRDYHPVSHIETCPSLTSNDTNDNHMVNLKSRLSVLNNQYEESKRLLNNIDTILETHKQLSLIEVPVADIDIPQSSLQTTLEEVQSKISYLERVRQAHYFLSTVSIPSAASSPTFTSSLRLLLETHNFHLLTPQLLQRICYFNQKCWDNAILVMERVLERDLISIEAYLDDEVYKEMRDKVLKELIGPLVINIKIFNDLIIHFLTSYCQLRENFVTFILDTRLNNQFSTSPPVEQVLHLIERTRLLMVVEKSEFLEIFGCIQNSSITLLHLNKILETVGNLLLQRIETICKQLSNQNSIEISNFIHPLMNSILNDSNQKDPFGLFLKLLTEKFNFKKPQTVPIIKIDDNIKGYNNNNNLDNDLDNNNLDNNINTNTNNNNSNYNNYLNTNNNNNNNNNYLNTNNNTIDVINV